MAIRRSLLQRPVLDGTPAARVLGWNKILVDLIRKGFHWTGRVGGMMVTVALRGHFGSERA